MVGKMILPRGGGSPQVWITAMVFFQTALLAGYAYAHFSVKLLGPRRQIVAHAVVLALPVLVLPIALPDLPRPDGSGPSLWILTLLTLGVGGPFFVLASASPLLQSWFSSTSHRSARDPYFLYASSNAGSLLGLLVYPFLVEPLLPLSVQSRSWAVGYGVFALLAIGCAAVALRAERFRSGETPPPPPPPDAAALEPTTSTAGAPDGRDRLFWVAAAAIPSALLMGVTHFLTSRIAPVPLLWVLPLALYLVTFIVAFARYRTVSTERVSRIVAILGVFLALALLARLGEPTWLIVLLHLSVLTAGALLCHQRLAERRPDPAHLTEFYLLISLGGVIGGAFSALAAPVVFNDIAEYPIAVALVALLRLPMRSGRTRSATAEGDEALPPPSRRKRILDLALPAALGLYLLLGDRFLAPLEEIPDGLVVVLLAFVPAVIVFTFATRPIRYALGLSLLFLSANSGQMYRGSVLHQDRTFFGVYSVTTDPQETLVMLYHGATAHGIQSRDPALAREPLAYYHRSGPAGSIVAALAQRPDKREIALVGAGTGALTALAGPHQRVTLYEIDPVVMEIAEDPRYFTFLRDARAEYETVIADGRIALQETDRRFDLIVLDAFTGGSIPVHLMTREAVQLYLERLQPRGALLFHVSNRHLALAPVLAGHARDLGLTAYERVDARTEVEEGVFGSHWVILVRSPEDLAGIPDAGWRELRAGPDTPTWTDDFSNLLTVQRWF